MGLGDSPIFEFRGHTRTTLAHLARHVRQVYPSDRVPVSVPDGNKNKRTGQMVGCANRGIVAGNLQGYRFARRW